MTASEGRAARGFPAAIAAWVLAGLACGVLVSLATGLPLAPEAGGVLGGLIAWRASRSGR